MDKKDKTLDLNQEFSSLICALGIHPWEKQLSENDQQFFQSVMATINRMYQLYLNDYKVMAWKYGILSDFFLDVLDISKNENCHGDYSQRVDILIDEVKEKLKVVLNNKDKTNFQGKEKCK